MRRTVLTLVCIMGLAVASAQKEERISRLENHIYYLASDSLHGRKAGSEDAATARAYILDQWKGMGLKPFFGDSFEDPFSIPGTSNLCNLVAVIPGCDPELKNEYIVVGAHFDHLGIKNGRIYNGADDNASGSAAVIEVARNISNVQDKLKRSVIIAAFDAEEMGLYGSEQVAKRMDLTKCIGQVRCMISVDMVGWLLLNRSLQLEGAGTLTGGHEFLERNADSLLLDIKDFETSIFTATDTRSFAYPYRIPTLSISTGLLSPYHKPMDDADLIDYDGLERITCFISKVVFDMATSPELTPTGNISPRHNRPLYRPSTPPPPPISVTLSETKN